MARFRSFQSAAPWSKKASNCARACDSKCESLHACTRTVWDSSCGRSGCSLLGLPVDHRIGFAGSLLERNGTLYKQASFSDSTEAVRGHLTRENGRASQRTSDACDVDCLSCPRLNGMLRCHLYVCRQKRRLEICIGTPPRGNNIELARLIRCSCSLSFLRDFVQSLHICRVLKPAPVSLFNRPTRFCAGNGPYFLNEAQTSPTLCFEAAHAKGIVLEDSRSC